MDNEQIVIVFFKRFQDIDVEASVQNEIDTFGAALGVKLRIFFLGAVLEISSEGTRIDLSGFGNTLYPMSTQEFESHLSSLKLVSNAFGRFTIENPQLNAQAWLSMMANWVNLK